MNSSGHKHSPKTGRIRGGRAVGALLIFAALAAAIGLTTKISGYPSWFLGLLLTLILVNLLVWVLEPRESGTLLRCKKCGRARPAKESQPCPHCGGRGFRMPMVNRVALGLITLSLAGCGGFYLLFAVTKGKGGRAWDASFKGLLFLLLAATVGAEGFGLSVASWFKNLNRFVGIQIESMDEDVRKLRRRRYPAVQIIILILTVVIYILAVNRLMSSG